MDRLLNFSTVLRISAPTPSKEVSKDLKLKTMPMKSIDFEIILSEISKTFSETEEVCKFLGITAE